MRIGNSSFQQWFYNFLALYLFAGLARGLSLLLLRLLDLRFGLTVTSAGMLVHRFLNQIHFLYTIFLYMTKLPIALRMGQLLVMITAELVCASGRVALVDSDMV